MNKALVTGIILCSIILFFTVIGPFLPFVTLEVKELYRNENGVLSSPPWLPSKDYPLGTDSSGRDMLSLLIIGASYTLFVVFIISLIRYLVAMPLAFAASNGKGIAYSVLNGWNNILSGLPVIFAFILLIFLPNFYNSPQRAIWFILILALFEVGRVGILFQQNVADISKDPLIEAGRAVGNSKLGLFKRYYMPFLLPQFIVGFVMEMGRVLLILGQLGFFGMFISQVWIYDDVTNVWYFTNTSIDWISMITNSRHYIHNMPWIPLFPVLAISITIIALNFLGEGLRQHFEGVSKRKYYKRKWHTLTVIWSGLKWAYKYKRPIIVLTLLIFSVVTTFNLFHAQLYGTEEERLAHEKLVYEFLASHYNKPAFEVIETTYDRNRIYGYKTTFRFTIAPEIEFGLTFVPKENKWIGFPGELGYWEFYRPDRWILFYDDARGLEKEHEFVGVPSLPEHVYVTYKVNDIIAYAQIRAERNKQQDIPINDRINAGDFNLAVSDSDRLTEALVSPRFGREFAGVERLMHYFAESQDHASSHDNHDNATPFKNEVFSYTSSIDVFSIVEDKGLFLLPTYGDVELVLEELRSGRPVILMDRNYDGSINFKGRKVNDSVIIYGYDEASLLGYNATQNEHIIYHQGLLKNTGLLPHPIVNATYNWQRNRLLDGMYYVFPQVFNSQMPEGLELYLLVDSLEESESRRLQSSLYLKLAAIDTFYKGEVNEQLISVIEEQQLIHMFDYEYAYYHLFIDPQPHKVQELLPAMLQAYKVNPLETSLAEYNLDVDDFLLLQELMYRYYVLTDDRDKANRQLESIMVFLNKEVDYYNLQYDKQLFTRLLQSETLVELGRFFIDIGLLSRAEDIVGILEDRGIENKNVQQLRVELANVK